MISPARAISRLAPVLVVLSLLVQPAPTRDSEKKLRVSTDYARIYLKPDDASAVVDTLRRGHVLSLLYSGKVKRIWYYVCFQSEETGRTKSGYVLDSAVSLLFDPLKTVTIMEESAPLRVHYAPRKFDEMDWGVSKQRIIEMEGRPSAQRRSKGLDIMGYHQKLINLDCSIEYIFSANRLCRMRFLFTTEYLDKNAYLEDYRKVKDALVQKFGRPLEEILDWKNPTFKDDTGAWGEAVSLGHLEMSSRWLTPQTDIRAQLNGKDEAIQVTVEYIGLRFKELARKNQED
jgi:hypothetical protein